MPKIFHGLHKNPPINPSYILNVRSLNKIFKAQNLFADMFFFINSYSAVIYLLKVNNRNARTTCEIGS